MNESSKAKLFNAGDRVVLNHTDGAGHILRLEGVVTEREAPQGYIWIDIGAIRLMVEEKACGTLSS